MIDHYVCTYLSDNELNNKIIYTQNLMKIISFRTVLNVDLVTDKARPLIHKLNTSILNETKIASKLSVGTNQFGLDEVKKS